MMRMPIVLLACCLFLSGAHAAPSAEAPEVRQLLESAEYWAGRQRPDLVRQLMRKLLAIQPRHPKALQALGLTAASPEPARQAATARASRSPARRPAPSVVAHAQTARTSLPQPQASPPSPQPDHPVDPDTKAEAADAVALRIEVPPIPVETELQAVWDALDQRRVNDGVQLGRALSSKYPDRPDVTRALALALRDAGERAEARRGLEQAVRQSLEAPASLHWVARESRQALQALDERRQPEAAAGITWVNKPGDAAVSRLDTRVVSLRMRQPWGDHGHWFGQLDSVRLKAGQSDAAQLIRSGDWGSAALFRPPPTGGASLHARAHGQALSVGYEADRWRADIGTTPLGFEFTRLSGGLDLKGRAGAADWRMSLGHRPVTGSLLSYGGQRDLFSGIRWGAVQRTSALLQVATTWRGMEPFAQLEVAAYRGHDVLANREQAAALGLDWTLSRGTDHYLAIGPVLRVRTFDNNQNHYSVGHGGYYSPQRSTTVGFPLQAAVRGTDLSWVMRLAPSWGESSTDSAPRFPTRADLQAQAVAQGQGIYSAGKGPSAGWALQSTWEYRMNAHWTSGLRVAAERSPDYAKQQVHIYLRWHEKPQRGPVPLWPSTVMPHAGV